MSQFHYLIHFESCKCTMFKYSVILQVISIDEQATICKKPWTNCFSYEWHT